MTSKELIKVLQTLPNLPIKIVQGVEYKEIDAVVIENNNIVLYGTENNSR